MNIQTLIKMVFVMIARLCSKLKILELVPHNNNEKQKHSSQNVLGVFALKGCFVEKSLLK